MKHSIILDDSASAELQELADQDGRTFSNFIARICYAWLIQRKEQREREEK